MAVSKKRICAIIHSTSMCCAAVGAGLAQVPGSDAAAITPLQVGMITAIAHEHGHQLTKAAAAKLLLPFAATIAGRSTSSILIGWLPGLGNVVNALTAAGITEGIGWAADAYFRTEVAA